MNNTTYLLGAGASYYSMPLLQTMNLHLEVFRDFIFHKMRRKHLVEEPTLMYLKALDDLILNVNQSTTLDQYAKSLYIGQRNNPPAKEKLKDLKVLLAGYLLFEQANKGAERFLKTDPIRADDYPEHDSQTQKLLKTQFDPRYRTFFNYTLDNAGELPQSINVLSWNYDLQIEGTYSRDYYTSLDKAQKQLNIYPSPHFDFNTLSRSKIIKLNGTAGVNRSENTSRGYENYITALDIDLDQLLTYVTNLYYNSKLSTASIPTLTFSFEQAKESETARNLAKQVLNQSKTIVVIGYSFSRLNHDVDFELFKDCYGVERIIFQVPSSDFSRVKNNFIRVCPRMEQFVVLNDDLSEFYVN